MPSGIRHVFTIGDCVGIVAVPVTGGKRVVEAEIPARMHWCKLTCTILCFVLVWAKQKRKKKLFFVLQ